MKTIGHKVIRLEETASTNSLVMETEAYLADHGLVVTARHQTGGRGRVGKQWVSLPGQQLQFSVVIHPGFPREEWPLISLMAGVAVAEGLEGALALRPVLKWPNDVLLDGKKVCGILVEMKHGPDGTPRAVVGIGINCEGAPGDFPPPLRGLLTTLARHAAGPVDAGGVLAEILARLQGWLEKMNGGEKPALLAAWNQRAELAGMALRYPTPQGIREGRALGLTGEGCLLIETAEGGHHVHSSGEVEWLA